MSGSRSRAARARSGSIPRSAPRRPSVIVAKQFKDYPAEHFERGVSVAIVKTRRNHPLALDPSIKGTNFLNNILAKIESIRAGAYEAVMLNWEGYVAEGPSANLLCERRAFSAHRASKPAFSKASRAGSSWTWRGRKASRQEKR